MCREFCDKHGQMHKSWFHVLLICLGRRHSVYLTEIFGQISILNSSKQGRNENILTSTDKLVTLKQKIVIWRNGAKLGDFDIFPTMLTNCTKEMIPVVVEHLTEKTSVEENIDHYFPSLNTEKYDWVRNPFVDVPSNIGFKLYEEELATISSDRSLKIKHSQISIQKEFPALAEKALLVL